MFKFDTEEERLAWEQEHLAEKWRNRRNLLLQESDCLIVCALEDGAAIPSDVKAYRQALRDVPQQAGFPNEIVWPVKPS